MWCPNKECPDALKSGSPAEFVDGMVSCSFCGAGLVSYEPDRAEAADSEIRLAPVMRLLHSSWRPRVKEILDHAGVRFLLQDEDAQHVSGWGGVDPGYEGVGAPFLMVAEDDLDEATDLLRDFAAEVVPEPDDPPPPVTPPAWQPAACPQCGKALESGEGDEPLAYCYHCGAPLSPEVQGSPGED